MYTKKGARRCISLVKQLSSLISSIESIIDLRRMDLTFFALVWKGIRFNIISFFLPFSANSRSWIYMPRCLLASTSTNLSNCSLSHSKDAFWMARDLGSFIGLAILLINLAFSAFTWSSSTLTRICNSLFLYSSCFSSSNAEFCFSFLFCLHLRLALLLRSLIRLYLFSTEEVDDLEAPPIE